MTKEKMKVKIAEILGIALKETKWKFSYTLPNVGPPLISRGFPSRKEADDDRSLLKIEGWICKEAEAYEVDAKLPNYPEDLNACHEMENTLSVGQSLGFDQELIEICGKVDYHATALQRCEAFLRVHNAWEEDEAE